MKGLLLLLLLLLSLGGQAQSGDSLFVSLAVRHAKEIHTTHITGESLLYNGRDYVRYNPLRDEHPYFLSDDWIEGTLSYDDQLYEKVWMFYDIYTDNVIIENYNFSYNIQLIPERIQYFVLEGHTFIRIQHSSVQAGFYELLYDGETKVFARHTKIFQKDIRFGELRQEFTQKTRYYIFHDGLYSPVQSKRSVVRVLSDRKHELNQQFRKNPINFDSDRELGILTLAQLYDQLKK